MPPKKVRVTFYTDQANKKKLKVKLAQNGKSLSQYFSEKIEAELKKR